MSKRRDRPDTQKKRRIDRGSSHAFYWIAKIIYQRCECVKKRTRRGREGWPRERVDFSSIGLDQLMSSATAAYHRFVRILLELDEADACDVLEWLNVPVRTSSETTIGS